MVTRCRVGYHFYKLKTWKHRVLTVLTGSCIGHVIVSVQTDNGIAYYDCTWGRMGGWYNEISKDHIPFDSVYENAILDLCLLDLLLPQETEKYQMWKVALHFYTGWPRSPSSCISSAHRIRYLMGRPTKGRSPGGLYKYLKKELLNPERTSG